MTVTYDKIATTTLGSAAADVTFSSVSSIYTDLVLICSMTQATAAGIGLQYNSDTATNYSVTIVNGTGSSATSSRQSNIDNAIIGYSDSTSVLSTIIVNIQNYSNTTTNKTAISRSSTNFAASSFVSLWRNTAAINSVKIFLPGPVNISSGSTFTLYGIKAE
jgi:hypothetical protein